VKKSREIVLLITSSLALGACGPRPPADDAADYGLANPSPTTSPTPGRSGATTGGSHGWWFGRSTGASSSDAGSAESGSISRGGFGGHASSAGE
jgi:hypothetical protein